MLYPDMMLEGVYYTAKELRGWTERYWLEEDRESWVVARLADNRLACVLNADITHAEEGTLDWVKRLGQWHLAKFDSSETDCGMPMLGNNYSISIPESERAKCAKCWGDK